MTARYLLRFDDACPTMKWDIWEQITALLEELDLTALVAVIPDNRDPKFELSEPRDDFWSQVREWQQGGWAIAMHGYQHLYTERNAGLFGRSARSEFAGLPRAVQQAKIRAGLAVFDANGITADAWIAPNHSFDTTTVSVLIEERLTVISDGMALYPHRCEEGAVWVPSQLWDFSTKRFGVWTVCLHPNNWDQRRFDVFRSDVERHRPVITDLRTVVANYGGRSLSMADSCYSFYRRTRSKLSR